ncbi:hypothetical protein GCM10010377_20030 [Streptomyces viridiviolaceus]|uniref:Uncharacterized protein n=1 Tax=Streptomyces viridiviolaceus TaxID=68282 RepID=A0ABW2DVK3_9ACTN|nr:hypothetical protein [Streptomyces viridiviolaceus]GHB29768.1 hypothetical protein GCM10010377_20030 [Streptomyces viridiviolaceus]
MVWTVIDTTSWSTVMGGVMKLGKALATGVAEERPEVREPEFHEEELRLPRTVEPAASVPEEVPAAR